MFDFFHQGSWYSILFPWWWLSRFTRQKTLIRQFSNGEERLQKKQPIRNQDDSKWMSRALPLHGIVLDLTWPDLTWLDPCLRFHSPAEGLLQRSHVHNNPGGGGGDGEGGDQRRGRQTWHRRGAAAGQPQLCRRWEWSSYQATLCIVSGVKIAKSQFSVVIIFKVLMDYVGKKIWNLKKQSVDFLRQRNKSWSQMMCRCFLRWA